MTYKEREKKGVILKRKGEIKTMKMKTRILMRKINKKIMMTVLTTIKRRKKRRRRRKKEKNYNKE